MQNSINAVIATGVFSFDKSVEHFYMGTKRFRRKIGIYEIRSAWIKPLNNPIKRTDKTEYNIAA